MDANVLVCELRHATNTARSRLARAIRPAIRRGAPRVPPLTAARGCSLISVGALRSPSTARPPLACLRPRLLPGHPPARHRPAADAGSWCGMCGVHALPSSETHDYHAYCGTSRRSWPVPQPLAYAATPRTRDARRDERPMGDGTGKAIQDTAVPSRRRRTGKTDHRLAETERPPSAPLRDFPQGRRGSALATCASCRLLLLTPLIELGLEPFGQAHDCLMMLVYPSMSSSVAPRSRARSRCPCVASASRRMAESSSSLRR